MPCRSSESDHAPAATAPHPHPGLHTLGASPPPQSLTTWTPSWGRTLGFFRVQGTSGLQEHGGAHPEHARAQRSSSVLTVRTEASAGPGSWRAATRNSSVPPPATPPPCPAMADSPLLRGSPSDLTRDPCHRKALLRSQGPTGQSHRAGRPDRGRQRPQLESHQPLARAARERVTLCTTPATSSSWGAGDPAGSRAPVPWTPSGQVTRAACGPHQRQEGTTGLTAGRAKKETPMRVKVAARSLPFQVWGYLSP